MDLVGALRSPDLLGALPAFRDLESWRAWLVFLRAFYGVPLTSDDLALFQKHTGRTATREGGYPEAVCITGRQSGKSQIAAAVAVLEAATSSLRSTHALLIAQDLRGAQRALFNYSSEAFETVPAFAAEVFRATADTLELRSGVSLSVYPCRPAAVRGIRACVAVVDELAFFIATDGRPTDVEMLRAVRPALATTGGRLLILSSPYGQSGTLWELHRRHYGREDSPVLVWQASAPEMNPTLPADYLDRMREDDPEAYRSEVLGEFRAGLSSLVDPDALDLCVDKGRAGRRPERGISYVGHYDASGGRSDAAALAIGHKEAKTGLLRADFVKRWPSPHDPLTVIGEAAVALRVYNCRRVQVDRYGGEFPSRAFQECGILANVAEHTTSEHYMELLPLVNSQSVVVPDLPDLLRELRGLERRRGTGGRDRVDHRAGAHDDLAAAVAGCLALLHSGRGRGGGGGFAIIGAPLADLRGFW